jgi:hypothetical protein
MPADSLSVDGVERVVCAGGLVPKNDRDPERWGYVRMAKWSAALVSTGKSGGGVRLSPIHTKTACPHLNRGYDGDGSEVIRVLLSNVEGHPILEGLGFCRWCTDREAVVARMQTGLEHFQQGR